MRPTPWLLAEPYRVQFDGFSPHGYGDPFGVFSLGIATGTIMIIASSGSGWEHVSASLRNRPPNWSEMCRIKDLFWGPEEAVVQFHPPKSEYVNHHPHCLHLWKPIGLEIPRPPTWMIGPLERNKDAVAE